MLNTRKSKCSLNPSDQQNECKESGTAPNTTSSSLSSSSTTTISSSYPLPPPLLTISSSSTSSSPITTTTFSRPNGSQLTEMTGNFPEIVSLVTGVSTLSSSSIDDNQNETTSTTCFNNSNNDNMTVNIEGIINCKSEKISVNLLSSKTFNKLTPNAFNLRPRISSHPSRKHHHHLSPSFSQHKRSELRRFNQNKGNDDSEGDGTANCYTSSSEHSMDTVIFCGKSMRSSCNANNNHQQQHYHQQNHHSNRSIPSSPNISSSPGKSKVPTITNGSPKITTTIEPNFTPMCQPIMMMVPVKPSNCPNLNMIQQQQQQQSSPKRYSSSSSNTTSSSPLINQLLNDGTIKQSHYKSNHSFDKKVHVKKLVCDIGTSPLHKVSLNCVTKCPPSCKKSVDRNDELWIDRRKKSKRKKPPHRISGVELWVDGPNAIIPKTNQISTTQPTECEYSEKHQRTTEWINQHAKTVLITNQCCGQHRTPSSTSCCCKKITDSTNETTSKSSKSNSSNGTSGTTLDLNNPASPYHVVDISRLTIKDKQVNDKSIETKEMACQTELNEIQIVSNSVNCTNNDITSEELNTEETLILLSNLHDNHEGDYGEGINTGDWTDERRLMLLERGALSDCCDNRVCSCCSSSFESDNDDEIVTVTDNHQDDKVIDNKDETIKVVKDKIENKENDLNSITKQNPNQLENSNDLAEPPGQLKLEQFLKQLITVTNPVLNDNESKEKVKKDKDKNFHQRHRSHHGYQHHHHNHHAGERKLSQPINHYNNYPQYDSLPLRRLTRSRFNGTKYYDSFGSHQDLTNCSIDNNQMNDLKLTNEEDNCKPVNYIITNGSIIDDCGKNHVTLLPTSPRVNRILDIGGAQSKVELVTKSPSKSSKKQSFNKRDTTSTIGHCTTTSEGDNRSVVTKKSSDSSSQSHDRTFNSSSSSASQYHHHHHHHYHHRSGQTSSGGPSSSGYDSTIKDEESDRELIIIDNQSNEINGRKLISSDEENTCCNIVTIVSSNNINGANNNNDSATNSNDISNNNSNNNGSNNNNSNNNTNTNLQGSCNIVKSSVKMRDKSEKQNRKNKKDKEKDKRESLSSEKCSFLCCKLTSFY